MSVPQLSQVPKGLAEGEFCPSPRIVSGSKGHNAVLQIINLSRGGAKASRIVQYPVNMLHRACRTGRVVDCRMSAFVHVASLGR